MTLSAPSQAPATPTAAEPPAVAWPSTVDAVPMGQRSDAALAACVRVHEVEAYTELHRRHLSSVTAVARMLLGSRAGCEDVVADVFTAFWLAPERFDPQRGTLLAFLRLNVRGRSIDLLRSDTARIRREIARPVEAMPSEVDAGMIDAEAAGDVRVALAQLPADERVPIELAFFVGLTYGAVALRLGLPEGTVKSRIRRGLRRMELMDGLQPLRTGPHLGRPAAGRLPLATGGDPPSLGT